MSDPTPSTGLSPDADTARAFADLAHEVRGITSGALMSAHTMTLARTDEERGTSAASLQGAMRHMVRLADDLRDVSNLLAARPPGARVEHDLVHAARRIAAGLTPDAELRKVELALESDGVPEHVVMGDPAAWDLALERLFLAGIEAGRRREQVVARLEPRSPGLALVVPCGALEMPPDGDLFAAWGEARRTSEVFPRGVWFVRAFLTAEGGGLTVEGEPGARRLVAVFPAARPAR